MKNEVFILTDALCSPSGSAGTAASWNLCKIWPGIPQAGCLRRWSFKCTWERLCNFWKISPISPRSPNQQVLLWSICLALWVPLEKDELFLILILWTQPWSLNSTWYCYSFICLPLNVLFIFYTLFQEVGGAISGSRARTDNPVLILYEWAREYRDQQLSIEYQMVNDKREKWTHLRRGWRLVRWHDTW